MLCIAKLSGLKPRSWVVIVEENAHKYGSGRDTGTMMFSLSQIWLIPLTYVTGGQPSPYYGDPRLAGVLHVCFFMLRDSGYGRGLEPRQNRTRFRVLAENTFARVLQLSFSFCTNV